MADPRPLTSSVVHVKVMSSGRSLPSLVGGGVAVRVCIDSVTQQQTM